MEIRAHLGGQYALGALSMRVMRRFERLMAIDPTLEQEVFHWQAHLEQLNMQPEDADPPARVWRGLVRDLDLGGASAPAESWWQTRWQSAARWLRCLRWRQLASVCSIFKLPGQ